MAEKLKANVRDGALFVFTNKRRTRLTEQLDYAPARFLRRRLIRCK